MAKGSQAPIVERVHCNHCRNSTDHRIVKTTSNSGETEEGYLWRTTFDMLECCGCREVVLRRRSGFSEDPEPDIRYFPPPVSRHPPRWRYRLPHELRTVFDEVYRSLDANTRCLPMMGARTLLDMLMVQRVGDVGSFKQKLKKLEAGGFVSAHHVDVLDAALDAGSAAAHRDHAPEDFQVNTVMDIRRKSVASILRPPRNGADPKEDHAAAPEPAASVGLGERVGQPPDSRSEVGRSQQQSRQCAP